MSHAVNYNLSAAENRKPLWDRMFLVISRFSSLLEKTMHTSGRIQLESYVGSSVHERT